MRLQRAFTLLWPRGVSPGWRKQQLLVTFVALLIQNRLWQTKWNIFTYIHILNSLKVFGNPNFCSIRTSELQKSAKSRRGCDKRTTPPICLSFIRDINRSHYKRRKHSKLLQSTYSLLTENFVFFINVSSRHIRIGFKFWIKHCWIFSIWSHVMIKWTSWIGVMRISRNLPRHGCPWVFACRFSTLSLEAP